MSRRSALSGRCLVRIQPYTSENVFTSVFRTESIRWCKACDWEGNDCLPGFSCQREWSEIVLVPPHLTLYVVRIGKLNSINGEVILLVLLKNSNAMKGWARIALEYLSGTRINPESSILCTRRSAKIKMEYCAEPCVHSKIHQVLIIGYERLRTVWCVIRVFLSE